MNTKFYLRSPEATTSVLILYATFDCQRLRFSTDISIPSKEWDARRQRMKRTYPGALEINTALEDLSGKATRLYAVAKMSNPPSVKEYIKENLQQLIRPQAKAKVKAQDFYGYVDAFLAASTLKPGSVLVYNTLKKHLKDFEKHTGCSVAFERFTGDFYNTFLKYLYNDAKNYRTKGKGITNNAVSKYVRTLKTVLIKAQEDGFPVPNELKKFKAPTEEADTVALTLEELEAIEGLELSENKRLERARDAFLVQCYTGLRYGDVQRLKPENFDLDAGVIRIRTQKTKAQPVIPITPKLQAVLARYPDLQLPEVSNQKINVYLKEVCRTAKISTPVVLTRYKGVERIEQTVPKYEAISTHTGRRTFITLSLMKGVLPEIVMKATGHRKRDQFQKYVRVVEEQVQDEMKAAWK